MEHDINWYKKKVKQLREENKILKDQLKLYVDEVFELNQDLKWAENEIRKLYYYLNY